MTIKHLYLSLALVFTCILGFSQTKEEAMRDAKLASKATMEADYNTVLKFTLPEVKQVMGGEEKAKNTMIEMFKSMDAQGFNFEKVEVLEVSEVVQEQNQYRCVVKSYNQMTMTGQRLKSTSHLLGIYNPQGKHWWFIEAKQLQNSAIKNQILPGFETALKLPEDEVNMEPIKQ